jgi:hypothetical protein
LRLGSQIRVSVGVLVAALLVLCSLQAQEKQKIDSPPAQRGVTRNPHGPIKAACQTCHTNTSWKPIRPFPDFNHNKTSYPLRGMHRKVDCSACHTKLVFTDVGMKCADCHADLHRGQFGARCDQCHTVKGWNVTLQAVKEHANRFPLLGAHAAVDCAACHQSAAVGQFTSLRTDCYSCHAQDYQNTKSSGLDHLALNFPTTCETCHGVDSWFGASFDHAKVTGFALTGAHAKLPCTACHLGGRFQGTAADCYGCHSKDFQGTQNPSHVSAGFPTTCQNCHNTSTWQGANFDHAQTGFPLTGAHASLPCTSCHVNGKFAGTPADCYSCHQKDFQGTTNPSHTAAGFPTDCSICHSTASWANATFNHNNTPFPLTGAHVNVPCASCHVGNKYAGTPTDCYSCHQKDFQGTTNPSHTAAGFPTDCSICHTTASWANASFNHNNTPFPLTGAHVSVPCTSCHINNNFASTPTDCYSCHKADYQGTTNPNHTSAGFPTTCQTCHTTSSWLGATFNHTYFPIPHHNAQCSDCHTNSSNYAVFLCTNCHTQTATGRQHQGVQGYVWNSTNCYACHKNGGGG